MQIFGKCVKKLLQSIQQLQQYKKLYLSTSKTHKKQIFSFKLLEQNWDQNRIRAEPSTEENLQNLKQPGESVQIIENLFLCLIVAKDFFLFLSQSHAAECKSVFFFLCSVMWRLGLLQYTSCVLWARRGWLSSCHTVAHDTCPAIWTDLLAPSADSQTLL